MNIPKLTCKMVNKTYYRGLPIPAYLYRHIERNEQLNSNITFRRFLNVLALHGYYDPRCF